MCGWLTLRPYILGCGAMASMRDLGSRGCGFESRHSNAEVSFVILRERGPRDWENYRIVTL